MIGRTFVGPLVSVAFVDAVVVFAGCSSGFRFHVELSGGFVLKRFSVLAYSPPGRRFIEKVIRKSIY